MYPGTYYTQASVAIIYYQLVLQSFNLILFVRGRLYIFTKKKFPLILQLHCVPLVPQIYQKILLGDPRWRTWFFEPRPFLPWEN